MTEVKIADVCSSYLDEIGLLQKKLDIAVKALEGIRNVWENNPNMFSYIARVANKKAKQALREIDLVEE